MTILTDALNGGTAMPSTISYTFVPGGQRFPDFGGETTKAWNAYERRQVAEALQTFENVLDVEFAPTNNAGAANFTLYSFDGSDDGLYGAFELPQDDGTSKGFFSHTSGGWDENDPSGGLRQGGLGFVTLIHELGHGMGLEHPHSGEEPLFPGVDDSSDRGDFDLNQGVFTTMTYLDGWQTAPHGTTPSTDYGYQGTPMAIDVAALQELYGGNSTFSGCNDFYTLPTANRSGTFYECLWDTGGTDQIRAGDTARAVTIDLNDATLRAEAGGGGFVSFAAGVHGGFTIANGVTIENATGGRGNDSITGNEARNVLGGGLGADILAGGAGRDAFVFDAAVESTGRRADRVADFTVRVDDIDLRGIDWSAAAGDQAFTFVTGPLTGTGQVHARQDRANGDTIVEAEVDGARGADLVIRLDGLLTLGASDFLL